MPVYRLHFVDADGHISGVRVLQRTDDDEAVRTATEALDLRTIEIWASGHLIERIQ
jgi:hypothetical protein